MVILTHKIRIYPNQTMKKQLNDLFGYSRYSFNVGLDLWNQMYEDGLRPNERKVRDTYKREFKQDWESEYPPNVFDNAVKDMAFGWKEFFSGRSFKPKFKSKRTSKNTFTINRKSAYTIRIKNKRLYLPKFKYGIRMSENPMFKGSIKMATVSSRAGKYWVSLSIDLDELTYLYRAFDTLPTVGVDANIGHFDTSEDKHRWTTPLNELTPLYERISHYQRLLSQKVRGSKKYEATRAKLQRTYWRIQNIQDDWLHKFTTYLVRNYKIICIEDLAVRNMLSNRRISRSIARSLFYRFRLFLQYKCSLYGNNLVIADRWFPSTQICSCCGFRKEGPDKLKLSDRVYNCNECGSTLDRDYNSACNLKMYAEGLG